MHQDLDHQLFRKIAGVGSARFQGGTEFFLDGDHEVKLLEFSDWDMLIYW